VAAHLSVPRLEIRDPGLASLRSATRAAIVMPAVFAFADKVIGDPQLATFAAFGSFAMLTLVEFGGPLRMRFIAYAGLACAGAFNITVGTLCSRDPWLAAGAMAVVGFAILFSGVLNSYVAAAATSGLLTFILAVMIPAPVDALPARLEGWALAAGVAIAAQMLLWPAPASSSVRADAAHAARAIADLADASLAHETETIRDLSHTAGEAVRNLRRSFLGAPHRQSGATGPQAAFGSLVDELGWLLSFIAPPGEKPGLSVCESENEDAVAAAVDALRTSASVLDGAPVRPDIDRLDETREALARGLARRIPELPTTPDDEMLVSTLGPAFRIRALSFGARQVAVESLQVAGATPGPPVEDRPAYLDAVRRPVLSAIETTEQVAVEHASARSVWFQNSLRGAVGLTLAVYIAQRSGLQHSFWVVLGTLSVLRSNALGTGWSIVSALAGTAVGILIGAALVIAIGTHETVLWAVLPVAVLVGSYAPRAISFAAGQAGFTVVLFVLFNLIQPSGWRVGLVRIEDVAIGFAISLGVGLLFWPRGAGALLRENLAYAYARSADYVVAAQRRLVEDEPDTTLTRSADAATAAAHRLDDAFRQYLTERSPRGAAFESAPALVAGAERVRRIGQSLSELAAMADGGPRLAGCGANLDGEANSARSWFVTLGDSLVHDTTVPPPHTRDADGRRRLLECVREAVAGGDETKVRPALDLLWASQHLDVLWRLEQYLGRQVLPATEPAASGDDALPEPA
jgi:uncharacterized membrane protein YccC